MNDEKCVSLQELQQIVQRLKADGKKIIHCHGVFDLLHIGHIRYFNQAKKFGDVLIVTITPDRFVDKGPNRPAFNENLRLEAVASLDNVDFAAINQWPTAEETLRLLQPHCYVKGSEFKQTDKDTTGKIGREEVVTRELNIELRFTEDIVFSSSNLINRYFSTMGQEIDEYLELFRSRYNLDQILNILDDIGRLKVLVIGETIIDEYMYCKALGVSSKDPVLATKFESKDTFAGGVLAVANHISSFVEDITCLTVLGQENSYEDFVKSQVDPKVILNIEYQQNAPTIVKTRYIDAYSLNKLFEVYTMDDSGLGNKLDASICHKLEKEIGNYDLVIVLDYGHGMITSGLIEVLCKGSKFLALNTQANAGNRGFNCVTRYPRADYISLAEHEIRLETRDLKSELRQLMDSVGQKLHCSKLVVTNGRKGCAIWNNEDGFVKVPAFARNIVDRVGAGDAFLSASALVAKMGVDDEIIGFIGNIAGSMAVEFVGNKKSIDKLSMIKHITSLMK